MTEVPTPGRWGGEAPVDTCALSHTPPRLLRSLQPQTQPPARLSIPRAQKSITVATLIISVPYHAANALKEEGGIKGVSRSEGEEGTTVSTPVCLLCFLRGNPIVSRNDWSLEATLLLYMQPKNPSSCDGKHLCSLHTCGSGGSSWAWHRSLLLPGPGLAQHVFLMVMTEVPGGKPHLQALSEPLATWRLPASHWPTERRERVGQDRAGRRQL